MSEPGKREPFLLRAGEGESVWSLGGRFTAKATAAATEQRFALVEALAFQATEPPLHIHHREDKAWYVLDGKMAFYVADEVLEATAGCFAFAPRGIPHTFTVDVEPTRVLVFASPAGFEHFVLELGEQARDDTPPANLAVPAPEVLGPVAERYGIEVVGPPHRSADGAERVPGRRHGISHAVRKLHICAPRAATPDGGEPRQNGGDARRTRGQGRSRKVMRSLPPQGGSGVSARIGCPAAVTGCERRGSGAGGGAVDVAGRICGRRGRQHHRAARRAVPGLGLSVTCCWPPSAGT